MNPAHIANYNGDTTLTRHGVKRWSLATVEYEGVDIDCHYDVDGYYLPATDVDPAEYPVCVMRKIEIGGVDVTRLLSDTRIAEHLAELVEQGWREEA
jgi:hypothetical protein